MASPSSSTSSRRWKTKRCGPGSGWPRPSVGSWFASPGGAMRPIRSRSSTWMLPHRMTKGYGEPFGQVVESVNGTKIQNLRHLVETLRDCKDEFLTFRFAEEHAETLVFRRQAILESTEPLMSQNGIPRRGSDDVLPIWSAKPIA